MAILRYISQGVKKVWQVKRLILILFLINFGLAYILGSTMKNILRDSLGHSAASQTMLENFDPHWYNHYFATSRDNLGRTFSPSVVGIGAVLKGLDSFITGQITRNRPEIIGLGIIYMLLWIFFSPVFIHRFLAHNEEKSGYFQTGAKYFGRFLTLSVMTLILYFLIIRFVGGFLSDWIKDMTRNMIDERPVFAWTVAEHLVVWTLIFLVNLIFDYTKIITVHRDLKWAIFAPVKGLGFVLSNLGRTIGIYLSLTVLWIILFGIYWLIAPGAGQSTAAAIWAAFAVGQIYVLVRIMLRAVYFGSECSFYESTVPAVAENSEAGV